jgi:hypothetical protein
VPPGKVKVYTTLNLIESSIQRRIGAFNTVIDSSVSDWSQLPCFVGKEGIHLRELKSLIDDLKLFKGTYIHTYIHIY